MQLAPEVGSLVLISVTETVRVYYLLSLADVGVVQIGPDGRLVLLDHATDVAQVELLHLGRLHVDCLLVLLDFEHGAADVERAELGGIGRVQREEHGRVHEVLGLVVVRIDVSRDDMYGVPLSAFNILYLDLLLYTQRNK